MRFDPERTSVHLRATFHKKGQALTVHVLIDTGSCTTTISHRDAEAMGLDPSDLEENVESSMTYAGRVRPLKLGNVDFIIVEESGRFVLEHLESVDVLPPTGDKELDDSLPSIIGMDFLTECSYSLHISPGEDSAFLEKVRPPCEVL